MNTGRVAGLLIPLQTESTIHNCICTSYTILGIANNGGSSSDSGAIIAGVVGGVILLLMITVVLCIVILCVRRCHRKGTFPVDNTTQVKCTCWYGMQSIVRCFYIYRKDN